MKKFFILCGFVLACFAFTTGVYASPAQDIADKITQKLEQKVVENPALTKERIAVLLEKALHEKQLSLQIKQILLLVIGNLKKWKIENSSIVLNNESTIIENQNNGKIYFAQGFQGKYFIIDIENGNQENFIPIGYEIVDQHNYGILPKYLILSKGSNLFSYQLSNSEIKEIFTSQYLLEKNEYARVFPSITEKDKFFIVIHKFNPNEEPGMGGPSTISKRSYFFDSSSNKVTENRNISFNDCVEYDSKNERFFTWLCGEGIGTSAPLSITDINGKKVKDIITYQELGASTNNFEIGIEYNNGLFFALSKTSIEKIIILDPSGKEPSKKIYSVSDEIKSKMKDKWHSY